LAYTETNKGTHMSTFDPNDRNRMTTGRPAAEDRTGMGMLGLLGAVAVAAVIGLGIWSMADNDNTTASNNAPGVTTGSSTGSAPAKTGTPAAPSR
jgi:hypothetical protein